MNPNFVEVDKDVWVNLAYIRSAYRRKDKTLYLVPNNANAFEVQVGKTYEDGVIAVLKNTIN